MPFRLRYKAHDLELPDGDFVIGRSAECQLSLDDPMVSRRHAVLHVRNNAVFAEDLGSRNGIVLNGKRIQGQAEVVDGDRIRIGSQEMSVHTVAQGKNVVPPTDMRVTQTLGHADLSALQEAIDENTENRPLAESSSKLQGSFQMLGTVADKAFAMGRIQEAERILQQLLLSVLTQAQKGPIDDALREKASRYAVRLARETAKGEWANYLFDLHAASGKLMPGWLVDELYSVVRKVRDIDLRRMRTYLADLRKSSGMHGPSERFILQRLEGLERLSSLQ